MLIWEGKSKDLYGNVFRVQKRAVLKVGKIFIEAGTPIPAGALSPERISEFKKTKLIKEMAPDVVTDDEPEEIEKPKRGRKPKVEASDVDPSSEG